MKDDKMTDGHKSQLRLECLKLAQARSADDNEPVLRRAKRYARFVLAEPKPVTEFVLIDPLADILFSIDYAGPLESALRRHGYL